MNRLQKILNVVKLHCRVAHERHPDLNDVFYNMWDEIEKILKE